MSHDARSRDHEFDPGLVLLFLAIDHEINATTALLFPLIQGELLSVTSGRIMHEA